MNIALIPGRLGSKRLHRKQLRRLGGIPLFTRAIRKARNAGVFDEVWVSASEDEFRTIAKQEGVLFHRRPPELSDGRYTCEDYILDFLKAHDCERLFEVQATSPLLDTTDLIKFFYGVKSEAHYDTFLTVVQSTEEHAWSYPDERNQIAVPINFDFIRKHCSQHLRPVSRITWGMSSWRRAVFLDAQVLPPVLGKAPTAGVFSGRIYLYPISKLKGHTIQTQGDLEIAKHLLAVAA